MSATIDPKTGMFLADTTVNPGTVSLPLSETGRTIIIKDAYGTFGTNPLTVETTAPDTFENGITTLVLNTANAYATFTAAQGFWYLTSITQDGIITSTIQGLASAGYISSPDVSISTLTLASTLNLADLSNPSNTGALYNSNSALYYNGVPLAIGSSFNAFNISSLNVSSIYNSSGPVNYQSDIYVQSTICTHSLVIYGTSTLIAQGNFFTNTLNIVDTTTNAYQNLSFSNGNLAVNGNPISALGENFCVASGYGDSQLLYSYDGINWLVSANMPFSTNRGAKITWNGAIWMTVGYNAIATSADGINWTTQANPFTDADPIASAWNGNLWVVVGGGTGANTVSIVVSPDGFNWTPSMNNPFSGPNGFVYTVAWNGSLWVIGGFNANSSVTLASSSDGLNWTPSANNLFSGFYGHVNQVAWNGSYWLAGGTDGTNTVCFATSTDGMTWTPSTTNPFSGGQATGLAWNGTLWVASGNNGGSSTTMAYSTDGMTWTGSTDNPYAGGGGTGITWNGTYWVAIGTSDRFYISVDGMTWKVGTYYSSGVHPINIASRRPLPYVGQGGSANTQSIFSTIENLGQIYISTAGLVSTVAGLGEIYISTNASSDIVSTVAGLGQTYLSTVPPDLVVSTLTAASQVKTQNMTLFTPTDFPIRLPDSNLYTYSNVQVDNITYAIGCSNDSGFSLYTSLDGYSWTPRDTKLSQVKALQFANVYSSNYYSGVPPSPFGYLYFIGGAPAQSQQHAPVPFVFSSDLINWTTTLTQSYFSTINSIASINGEYPSFYNPPLIFLGGVPQSGNTPIQILVYLYAYQGVPDGQVLMCNVATTTLSTVQSVMNGPPALYETSFIPNYVATGQSADGYSGGINYSLDGYNWMDPVSSDPGFSGNSLYSYQYTLSSISIYVAGQTTTPGGQAVQLSVDNGSNWVGLSTPFETATAIQQYNYGAGILIGGSIGSSNIIGTFTFDTDQTTITSATYASTNLGPITSIGSGPNGFAAISLAGGADSLEYSVDGITWSAAMGVSSSTTLQSLGSRTYINDAILLDSNQTFQLIQSNTSNYISSVPTTIQVSTILFNTYVPGSALTPFLAVTDLKNAGSYVYTCGYGLYNTSNAVLRSTDGLTWSQVFFDNMNMGISYLDTDGSVFLVSRNRILYSTTDFIDFTLKNTSFIQSDVNNVYYKASQWFVLQGGSSYPPNTNTLLVSPDLITWTHQSISLAVLRSFDTNGTDYLICGDPTTYPIMYSNATSGQWTDLPAIPGIPTYNGIKFLRWDSSLSEWQILVGYADTYYTATGTPDNFTITSNNSPVTRPQCIANNSTTYVIVGDGISYSNASVGVWTLTSVPTSLEISKVIWNSSQSIFVATCSYTDNNSNIAVFTSPDGITWANRNSNLSPSTTSLSMNYSTILINGVPLVTAGGAANFTDLYASTIHVSSIAMNDLGTGSTLNLYASSGTLFFNERPVVKTQTDEFCVVIGDSIAYSYDGQLWFQSVNPMGSESINTVAWNGKIWVVGGSGNGIQIMTSPDGINWTPTYSHPFDYVSQLVWNGKIWVAVGDGSSYIARSVDGINWTSCLYTGSSSPYCVAWNGSYWLAGGYDMLLKSLDGIIWYNTYATPFTNSDLYCLAWNGSLWIAGGWTNSIGSHVIYTSVDGIYWYEQTTPFTGNNPYIQQIAWNGSAFVAVGGDNLGVMSIITSPDGYTWTESTNDPFMDGYAYGITWNGSLWVATGYGFNSLSFDSLVCVATSPDGLNWTPSATNPFPGTYGYQVASRFLQLPPVKTQVVTDAFCVAGSYYGGGGPYGSITLAYSYDGVDWLPCLDAYEFFGLVVAIGWNGSYWLAGGGGATQIAMSPDGISWVPVYSPFQGGYCSALAWNGSLWVATGANVTGTCIATSPDGLNWTTRDSPLTYSYGVAWNGAYFVVVGTNTDYSITNIRSPDGIHWTAGENPFTGTNIQGQSIAWNGTYWLMGIYGVSYTCPSFATSTDGLHWTLSAASDPFNSGSGYCGVNDLVWASFGWVAVGENNNGGVIATSLDGINWTVSAPTPLGGPIYGITFNGTYLIANGVGMGQSIIISRDGVNWTLPDNSPFSSGVGICIRSRRVLSDVASAPPAYNTMNISTLNTSQIDFTYPFTYTSSTTSTIQTPFGMNLINSSGQIAQIAYTSNIWIVAGNTSYGTSSIQTSVDGRQWTAEGQSNYQTISQGIAYNNGKWVVGGYPSPCIQTSTDGLFWTGQANSFGAVFGVSYGNGIWVATGYSGSGSNNTLQISSNTTDWFSYPTTFTTAYKSVYFANCNIWIATGQSSSSNLDSIQVSDDAMTWIPISNSAIQTFCVAANSNLIVVGGSSGIQTSTDGYNWTTQGSATSYVWGITYDNGIWVATGNNNLIQTSTDGITWTSHPCILDKGFSAAYHNGVWLAVGYNADTTSTIVCSVDNGQTWSDKYLSISNVPTSFSSISTSYITADSNTIYLNGEPYGKNSTFSTIYADQVIIGKPPAGSGSGPGFVSTYTQAFSYTGTSTLFTIPDGVSSIGIQMWGAGGGSLGGGGAFMEGVYTVQPGDASTMAIFVGAGGGSSGNAQGMNYSTLANSGGAAFSVSNISGLKLWLDASDTASLTFSGSTITSWADRSGQGNTATGVGTPTFSNNKVVFNGSNAGFSTPYTCRPVIETVFVVSSRISDGRDILSPTTPGNGGRQLTYYATSIYLFSYAVAAVFGGCNLVPSNTLFLYDYTYNPNLAMAYENGSNVASVSNPLSFSFQGSTNIGFNSGGNFEGSIAEIMIFDTILTNNQRQQVEGYLSAKWNLGLPQAYPAFIPWRPTALAGLQLWLDGADPLGTGVQPVITSIVPTWTDKSPFSNSAIISTGTVTTTFSNGINFDSNSYYTLPDGAIPYDDTSYDYFLVINTFNAPAAGIIVIGGANAANGLTALLGNGDGTIREDWGAFNAITTSATQSQNNLIEMSYTSGGLRTLLINSNFVSDTPGVRSQANYGNIVGQDFVGSMSEFIVFNRVLNDPERDQVKAYLAAKWNTTLASSNPYYTIPLTLSPFTPSTIEGCQLWLDAADSATLTLSGNMVISWADKSGEGHTATPQGTPGTPFVNSNIQNGLPGVVTDIGSYIQSEIPAGTFLEAFDAFVVYNSISENLTDINTIITRTTNTVNPNNPAPLDMYYLSGVYPNTYLIGDNSNGIYFNAYGTYNFVNYSTSIFNVNVNQLSTINITPSLSSYDNGIQDTLTGVVPWLPTDTGNVVTLGGRGDGGTTHANFYEVIVYNRSLPTYERQVVEGYLAWKWGIPLAAPHPYAAAPPGSLVSGGGGAASGVLLPNGSAVVAGGGGGGFYWAGPQSVESFGGGGGITKGGDASAAGNSLVFLRAVDYSGSGPWHDQSGYGRDATLEDGTIAKNIVGNGIVLDGSTSWTFPNVAVGNAWTASVWYKNTGPQQGFQSGDCGSILTQIISGATNLTIGDINTANNGKVQCGFNNGGWNVSPDINLTNGAWINIQATWDGTNLLSYVNGSLASTTQPGLATLDSGLAYRIGRRWDGTSYMLGEIGEVHIYGYPLTPAQVQAEYQSQAPLYIPPFTPPPGLQVWLDAADTATLTFSGSNITSWADKSGNSNTATAVGAPFISSSQMVFDGATTCFTLPDGAYPYGDSSYDYFMVVNPTTLASPEQGILSGGADTGQYSGIFLFTNGDDINCREDWNSSAINLAGMSTIQNNLLEMSYTTGGQRFFTINTSISTDSPGVQRTQDNTNNLLGAYFGSNLFFQGTISEVLVFNTVLTTFQRQQVQSYLAYKWSTPPATNPLQAMRYPLWNPSGLQGMRLWLDASDSASLTFSSSNAIATWADKSGNSNTATAVGTTLLSNGQVLFDGSTSGFTLPDGTYPYGDSSYDYFMIVNVPQTTISGAPIWGGTPNVNNSITALIGEGVSSFREDWYGSYIYTECIIGQNLIEMSYTTGGNRGLLINGNFVSDTPDTRLQDKFYNTIGFTSSGYPDSFYFQGTISELIVFNRSLTQPERDQVQAYLAWKWDAEIPYTNPFYTIPPQMAPAAKGAQGLNGGVSAQGVSSFAGYPVPVANPIQGSFGLGADAAYSISSILTGGGGGGGSFGGGGGVFGAGGGGDSIFTAAFSTISTIPAAGILPGYYQLASNFHVAQGGSLLSNGQDGFVFLTWQSTIDGGSAPVVNYEALQVYKDALFTSTVIIENSINLSTSVLTADSNTLYLNGLPVGASFFNTLFVAF